MVDVEPMIIDGADERKPLIGGATQKKSLKRKLSDRSLNAPCAEGKLAKISELRDEVNSLVKCFKDLASENRGKWLENTEKVGISSASLNCVIACLMEESDLPLSKLVDEIFEKVKGSTWNGDGMTKASVKSKVLSIGKRSCYGVKSADADVLEDEDELALWCWETRDLKLMPKSARISLKVHRTCWRKIHERITTLSAMIDALEKYPNSQQELVKASEKLNKILNESDIRLLMESMAPKSGAEMAEKEAGREEKLLIKQMEKEKKEMERERKKKEREKLRSEKELKQLHDEAEKEERRREREEIDIQKQLKRQQEEAEKDQRRREKEEAEMKKRLAIQKQASLMERFLKRGQSNSSSQTDNSGKKAMISGLSPNMHATISKSLTLTMDSVLAQKDGINLQDIWKSHLNAWLSSRFSTNSNRKRHWGIRQKPKIDLIKELKLTTNKELTSEKLAAEWEDSNYDTGLSQTNTVYNPLSHCKKRMPVKQLLQFDKTNRPAFYGVWPRKSQVVGARRPFAKDSNIEYDIDSDEEWEEDEPGESLSDCDKDVDDDENSEGLLKDDDGDESEDGFFVPDGYLSENEGVTAGSQDRNLVEEVQDPSPEFCTLLRQQKYLNNFTEHALKKNKPLIILNLAHDKTSLSSAEELTGIAKLEKTALQTLSLRPFPGCLDIEISVPKDVEVEVQKAVLDSDLPQIISIIQSSAHSIKKIEKSLNNKFPAVPVSQLRNKIKEISEFADNRWQVKKEILSKHGMNVSPVNRSSQKMKSIATFLEKKCDPPSGETKKTSVMTPESSEKPAILMSNYS